MSRPKYSRKNQPAIFGLSEIPLGHFRIEHQYLQSEDTGAELWQSLVFFTGEVYWESHF
jgi:hypothetical protein